MTRRRDDHPHMSATASGHSQNYQVFHGNMRVTNHTHQYLDNRPQPLDLAQMRAWVDHLCRGLRNRFGSYEHQSELDLVWQEFHQQPSPTANQDSLRRLLASGVVEYLSRIAHSPVKPNPDALFIDVLIFALWPVIEIPKLPDTWQHDLATLTSPRLAHLVAEARKARAHHINVTPELFTRQLVSRPFASGLLTFMEDLNNPRKGGGALTALALAGGMPKPPRRGGARATLKWVLLGAAGEAAVIHADHILTSIEALVHHLDSLAGVDIPTPGSGTASGLPWDPFTR